jgi:hypothetical protein
MIGTDASAFSIIRVFVQWSRLVASPPRPSLMMLFIVSRIPKYLHDLTNLLSGFGDPDAEENRQTIILPMTY